MFLPINPDSSDFDFLYVELRSGGQSPPEHITPDVPNSTETSGVYVKEVITKSSGASRELQIVTIASDSNELTIPYGYGRQQPYTAKPQRLKTVNLRIIPFNVMTPISPAPIMEDHIHPPTIADIPIQEEVFDASEISTPSMLVCSVNACETSPDVGIFYSDEPKWISPTSSPSSTPPPPRGQKRKLRLGMSFPQEGVYQHTCKASSQPLAAKNTPQCST